MEKIFEYTLNTRPILEDNLKFIRSDVPNQISEQEKEWLISKNITSIIDLRTEDERTKKECPLEKDERFQYYCMPVTGGNVVPQSVDDVSKSYINMVDEQMYKIVDYTVMRLVGRLSNSLWTWKNCILRMIKAGEKSERKKFKTNC